MTFAKTLLILTTIFTFAWSAVAQAPAAQQTVPAKVGVINSAKFSDPNGGITRLTKAFLALETEFKPRRDEIAGLVTRFNTLQQVPAGTTPAQLAGRREQAETLQIEIQRKQEDARAAYSRRTAVVTNPIRLRIYEALEVFAKQKSIDVLLDISKFPEGVLLANQNADLTPAFIRDFNSKNP